MAILKKKTLDLIVLYTMLL